MWTLNKYTLTGKLAFQSNSTSQQTIANSALVELFVSNSLLLHDSTARSNRSDEFLQLQCTLTWRCYEFGAFSSLMVVVACSCFVWSIPPVVSHSLMADSVRSLRHRIHRQRDDATTQCGATRSNSITRGRGSRYMLHMAVLC